jgi:hypothetical protein
MFKVITRKVIRNRAEDRRFKGRILGGRRPPPRQRQEKNLIDGSKRSNGSILLAD